MQIPDNAAATFYFVAYLHVQESLFLDLPPDQRLKKQQAALELYARVIHHPATWQMFRDRAQRALADLAAGLPEQVAAAAVARARDRPLFEVVQEFLDEAGN